MATASDDRQQVMAVDATYSHVRGIAGLGVVFKGGRVICAEVTPAESAGDAEVKALLRAAEIATKTKRFKTLILSDSTLAVAAAEGRYLDGKAAQLLHEILTEHPRVRVEWRPRSFVKSAHILARQTLNAWAAAQGEDKFTWTVDELLPEAA